jgi:hypothetical protein
MWRSANTVSPRLYIYHCRDYGIAAWRVTSIALRTRRRKPLELMIESPRQRGGHSSKCRGVTAVHRNGHAGDVVAGRTGQPDGGSRHILGLGPSPLGDARQNPVM